MAKHQSWTEYCVTLYSTIVFMDGCWELIELATNKKRADGIICIVIELDWMRGGSGASAGVYK